MRLSANLASTRQAVRKPAQQPPMPPRGDPPQRPAANPPPTTGYRIECVPRQENRIVPAVAASPRSMVIGRLNSPGDRPRGAPPAAFLAGGINFLGRNRYNPWAGVRPGFLAQRHPPNLPRGSE